ncbi:MAG: tripartite tricarboxylate transporter permease [Oscillospiraceae bacterium]|nr:tripartite tricarboxylate transporter permease [Oscillospiraceae bacterium]
MEVFSTLGLGFSFMIENPISFAYLTFGVFMGMVFGAIPALSAALAVSLILPFTFAMVAGNGLSTLVGIYVGGISGGLISAILLNIPGTVASMVTCFDGSPMAKKGMASEALLLGVYSSMLGGIISGFALIFIAPQLAKVALTFGPWEYLAIGLMGLSIVVSLISGGDMLKGFIGCIIGIMLGCIGIDAITNVHRFTFGMWQLGAGLNSLPVLIGIFAFSQILGQVSDLNSQHANLHTMKKLKLFPERSLLKGQFMNVIRSSVIGIFIGILPGVGQSTASMISYDQAKQASKTPEMFGEGCPDGLVASETSNNAVCGGAMIPMLTMGIPGDAVTNILLGGFIVHGLQPGPLLFTSNKDIIGTVFVAYMLANVIMYVMMITLMPIFIKSLTMPIKYMFPILIALCALGCYTLNNRVFDVWVLFLIGLFGYILTKNGFKLQPITMGFVLSKIIEKNGRTAIMGANGNIAEVFTRPIAVVLFIVAIVMAFLPLIKMKMAEQKAAKAAG